MGREEIILRLRRLSEEMIEVGTAMDYYGGTAEWSRHGQELCGAAVVAGQWADEIEGGT